MIRPCPKPQPRKKEPKPLRPKRWGIKPNPEGTRRRRERSGRADELFTAEVRKLPCCACRLGMPGGGGRIDPHHAGRRPGWALKCHDRETIPMCRNHHRAIERDHLPFKDWPKEKRIAWVDLRIAETQATVDALLAARGTYPPLPA